MPPDLFLNTILDPGLVALFQNGGPAITDAARRFLLAIAMQESGPKLEARYQNSPSASAGPAHGWWQFEQDGGVAGVWTHPASSALALTGCTVCTVAPNEAAVWRALEGHDLLSPWFARLLVWTDPDPLPQTQSDGWTQYMRLWRPGIPHEHAWPANWAAASDAVRNTAVDII